MPPRAAKLIERLRWCHLEGAPIKLQRLDPATRTTVTTVLAPVSERTQPQCTVSAGPWQAARSLGPYSLAACMVAPGFEFEDFTLQVQP